jgi:hypothetical protein
MSIRNFVKFLALPALLLLLPAISSAQRSVTCESNDGRRKYCSEGAPNSQITMDRQISQSPCVQGRSWGVDRRGLWVDRGCRAVFLVSAGWSGEGEGGGWWRPDPGDTWPPSGNWHGGNWGRGGACFYKDRNFGGGYFCLRRGENRDTLGSFGDDISSIRVFGGARVTIYNDRGFRGGSGTTVQDVADLRNWSFRGGHTWNNRISSVRIQ